MVVVGETRDTAGSSDSVVLNLAPQAAMIMSAVLRSPGPFHSQFYLRSEKSFERAVVIIAGRDPRFKQDTFHAAASHPSNYSSRSSTKVYIPFVHTMVFDSSSAVLRSNQRTVDDGFATPSEGVRCDSPIDIGADWH
jgi:hypothetical protein